MPETLTAAAAAIASAIATTTVTAAGTVTTLTTFGSFLVSTALSTTLGLIGTAIQGGFGGDGGNAPDRPITLTGDVSARILTRYFGFGRHRVRVNAGAYTVFAKENSDHSLYRIIVFDCDTVAEVEQHFINDEPVSLDANGWVQEPQKWRDKIQIVTRLADDNQTAPQEMLDAFPGVWTADHRGRGLSYVIIRQDPTTDALLSETYPNGGNGEQWSAVVRSGADTYDPRDGSSGYSDNLYRVLLRVLMHPFAGQMALEDFILEDWAAAVEAADAPRLTPDGAVEARYRALGQFGATPPGEGIGQLRDLYTGLLAAGDGRLYERDGRIGVVVGRGPVLDGMPFGRHELISLQLSRGDDLLGGANATNASFVDPALGFTGNHTPHFPVAETAPLSLRTVELKYCPSYRQAGEIAWKTDLQHRSPTVIEGVATHAGILLREAATARFDMLEIGAGDYTLETVERGALDEPIHRFDGWLIPAGWDAFDAVANLVPQDLPVAVDTEGSVIAAPADVCAGSIDAAGTIRFSWGEPTAPGLQLEYEYSAAGAGQFVGRANVFPATLRVHDLDVSAIGGDVDVRVRFFLLSGGVTDWVEVAGVDPDTLIGAPSAPGTSGLPGSYDLSGQTNMDDIPFFASWATTQCVRVVRVYVETGVTPPTVQAGADTLVVDGDIPLAVGTGEVTGLTAGDTVYVQVEIENVSGQTTRSAVHSIAIVDGGA